jgi:hypothetical protein
MNECYIRIRTEMKDLCVAVALLMLWMSSIQVLEFQSIQ